MANSTVFNPFTRRLDYTGGGSTQLFGSAILVAGTVTVSLASVTANSDIFLTGQNTSGTAGELTISARIPGVSFTITSTSAADTRTVAWLLYEPAMVPSNVGANAALTLLGP